MKKIVTFSSLAVFALLTACATTPNNSLAIQKENNLYEVTGLGKSNIIYADAIGLSGLSNWF